MSTKRYLGISTLLNDGRVLVSGGYDDGNVLASIEIFSNYTPVAFQISGGTAPYTANISSGSSGVSRSPLDNSVMVFFPNSTSTINFYFSDYIEEESASGSIEVSP